MRKTVRGLSELTGTDILIRVERQSLSTEDYVIGFLLGMSDNLLFLQTIEGNNLMFDGYHALRVADISSWRPDETFVPRALHLMGRKPTPLEDVDLSNWDSLIRSLKDRYRLIQIETAKKEPDICFIGRVLRQTSRSLTFRKIDGDGDWLVPERFRYADITDVCVDSGYLTALTLFAEQENPKGLR